MKVFIGADHRGFDYKANIIQWLEKSGHEVVDVGMYDDSTPCDYPRIGQHVAMEVAKDDGARGILVCMSGLGQAIVANKVTGAYAALCYNPEAAELSRKHNNANVLVLGSLFVKTEDLERILEVWLNTEFEGGRHERRVNQIKEVEKGKILDGSNNG